MNNKTTTSRANTASQAAKAAGFKSLSEVRAASGKSLRTLNDWFHEDPLLFDAVLEECVQKSPRLSRPKYGQEKSDNAR